MANLTKEQKVKIFNDVATNTYTETGYLNGLDKKYASDRSMSNAIGRIVRDILKNPGDYGVSEDKKNTIEQILKNRQVASPSNSRKKNALSQKKADYYMEKPVEELVEEGSKKAYALLNMKMDTYFQDNKKLDKTSLSQFTSNFDTMFDVRQIVSGKATEHIAFQGEIDTNMKPEEALEAVMKLREKNIEDNNDR